jgi:glutaminyl-peptide cyclotransferase
MRSFDPTSQNRDVGHPDSSASVVSHPCREGTATRMGHPLLWLWMLFLIPCSGLAQQHFRGDKALEIARQFVAIGPRPCLGPGHLKAEAFLRSEFKHDQLEEDTFTANTPIGPVPMRNFIVRFPGKKEGVIVLTTHYETNYPLRNIGFVGANDGGSTTGMLIEIANEIRGQATKGGVQEGYSVWLVFLDGEEAIERWQDEDNTYGSRHLAAKWGRDGTLKRIKALLLADMLGDKDLNVLKESQSTPWLSTLVAQAARNTGHAKYFFQTSGAEEDDHLPFVQRGVPSIDVIDIDYGPHTAQTPDGYHHTAQDTMDKISAKSLTIAGDVFLETIKLVDQK